MVRLSLFFLSTTIFAFASAAPLYSQHLFKITSEARCISNTTSIKEYKSFRLLSHELGTFVSMKLDGSQLVGGVEGDTSLKKLEFCAVSSDHHCDPFFSTNCILENVGYHFRLKDTSKRYLQVDGQYVRFVNTFEEASSLSLSNDDGLGVRIAHKYEGGEKKVFAIKADEESQPIVLEYLQKKGDLQRFDIAMSHIPKCLPDIYVKESELFLIKHQQFDSFVSLLNDSNVLCAGVKENQDLQLLKFSVAKYNKDEVSGECIYEDVEYRFRVHGPTINGFLRVEDGFLVVVPEFKNAGALHFHKPSAQGVRISQVTTRGIRAVVAKAPTIPLVIDHPEFKTEDQMFDLVPFMDNWVHY
ncbi:hypothetical protein BGX24_006285 [Mortierella sp. AD032]|nr:hypothetical protein BGX24_006285 [Mortierella sp. AD032]